MSESKRSYRENKILTVYLKTNLKIHKKCLCEMVKLRVCVLLLEGYSGIGLLNKSPFQTLKKGHINIGL